MTYYIPKNVEENFKPPEIFYRSMGNSFPKLQAWENW